MKRALTETSDQRGIFKIRKGLDRKGPATAATPGTLDASSWRGFGNVLAGYGFAALASLLLVTVVLKLWRADPHIPLVYGGGDILCFLSWIKGLVDNGWYLHNDYLGMPFGQDMYDFPLADNLHFAVLKLLALISSDYALVCNAYFLLTFPLTTLTALFVFRRLGFAYAPSLVGSLLFAFLPYHFARGIGHIFLASYYLIPLMVLVIVWVYAEKVRLFDRGAEGRWSRKNVLSFEVLASVVICLLMSSGGVYYAFFGCFLLLVAGITSSLWKNKFQPLGVATVLVVVTSLGVFANILPSLLFNQVHGANPESFQRLPSEAETFGMKIIQLLVPVNGHRVSLLAQLSMDYNNGFTPLLNENGAAALGLVGSCGFLILIARLFWRRRPHGDTELLDGLSMLNLFAILLATIGGFGACFSFYICPLIRAYNRISVYIAFFALVTVVWLLHRIYQRYVQHTRFRPAWYAFLAGIAVLGVLDQTTSGFVPPYRRQQQEYRNDAAFVQRIEASLPAGCLIQQMPYHPFPECLGSNAMLDYDLFRGYLHSKKLRWSYGAIRGREGDHWQRELAVRPVREQVRTLAFAGFAGIYLDRAAFADKGKELETELVSLLQVEPMVSANERLAFFDLRAYTARLKESMSAQEWEQQHQAALQPLYLCWVGGFYALEGSWQACFLKESEPRPDSWRWCSAEGKLIMINPSQQTKPVELRMLYASGHRGTYRLRIQSAICSQELDIEDQPQPLVLVLHVPPGEHTLKFTCDAPRLVSPADPRNLVFRVLNVSVRELE